MRSRGCRMWMVGLVTLTMAAHAETDIPPSTPPEIPSGPVADTPSAPFDLLPGADPWALGGEVCIPAEAGVGAKPGPVRARRPRRVSARPVDPAPAIVSAIEPPVCKPSCVPEPPAHDVAMSAGPEVFNVLTAGAAPNSSITLRIDNRTTVTITVNADRVAAGFCPVGSPGGPWAPGTATVPTPVPAPVPAEVPAQLPAGSGGQSGVELVPVPGAIMGPSLWSPEWTERWAAHRARSRAAATPPATTPPSQTKSDIGHGNVLPGPELLNSVTPPPTQRSSGSGIGGNGNGGGGSTQGGGGQVLAMEPSTMILLGSGIWALVLLARRRR